MATLAEERDVLRRSHEFEVQTRRDRNRFAFWVLATLITVAASLALGIASTGAW
jgi:hypothetical protein